MDYAATESNQCKMYDNKVLSEHGVQPLVYRIDLYPLLRNYDVLGIIVGINWNMKRWWYGEHSGKVSILREPNSCKRGKNPRKLLLGKLLSLHKLSLYESVAC